MDKTTIFLSINNFNLRFDDMEFRDLKYFVKLVELKNYNQTAKFFNVTQPAISSMVKRLENEIGTTLIFQNKNRKNMTLSPAGKVVYKNAKELIKKERSIIIEAKRANENNFRLGYSELAGKEWLASVITKLNKGHLLASIETHEENSHHLEQHLREGKYDAIVFSRLENEKFSGIKLTTLETFQYNLVVPINSPLANLDQIDLFQIGNTPLIMRHKRFLSRTALDQISNKINFTPKKSLIVDSIDATLQLIEQGMGVGFLMNFAVKNNPNVKAIPLIPSQRIHCYSTLGIREGFVPNAIQKKCIDILKGL